MNKLMQIVAEHGNGTDILEMANLLRSAGKNVPYTPITMVRHEHGNVYDCVGFTPIDTFRKMSTIEQQLGPVPFKTKLFEQMLKDQQLVEQMAIIACLLIKQMPVTMVSHILGGQPDDDDDDDDALPF